MALGDLSPDQATFVQLVSSGTGLDPRVVTSWVGTESGWSINKPTHNYLNIGPGERFHSTQQAAERTVGLIRGSSYYSGIVASAAQGPGAQIQAIGSSKWGTQAKTLNDVYTGLTGVSVVSDGKAQPVDFTLPNWLPFGGGSTIETPDLPSPGDVLGSIGGELGKVATLVTSQLLQGVLSIVFVASAVGMIGLGAERLTRAPAKKLISSVGGGIDRATSVAGLVPTPAAGALGRVSAAGKAASVV